MAAPTGGASPVSFDWNDLRIFAAVLEHGSTARAARALGIDQTTCARRMAALEGALGVQLFVRDPTGYRPTPEALVLQPPAEAVVREVERFAVEAANATRRTARTIRLTCEEFLTRTVVAPALARFTAEHPQVQVEIDVSSELRDLQAGEADVAIRTGPPPDAPTLIRRKLSDSPWSVYCSAAYAAARAPPADIAACADHPIVCIDSLLEAHRANGLGSAVRQVVNSVIAAEAALRAGAGVGALPKFVGDHAADLVLCFPIGGDETAIWLIYPERLRRTPEVRALADLIAAAFRRSPSMAG
jgi:DNA-binding transcriptional LysR family regulator